MKCPSCDRDFPVDCLRELATGGPDGLRYESVCPLCALEKVNAAHGLPAGTPFRGPGARALCQRAEAHLRATGQG